MITNNLQKVVKEFFILIFLKSVQGLKPEEALSVLRVDKIEEYLFRISFVKFEKTLVNKVSKVSACSSISNVYVTVIFQESFLSSERH